MKKWIKENKGLFIKLCFLVGLLIIFIILNILKKNVDFCEAYSRGFGRVIGTVLAFITRIYPLSLAETSIILGSIIVIILIVIIIKELKKKNWLKAISKTLTILLIPVCIITGYFITSEMQYNRKELPVPLYKGEVQKSEYYDIVDYFINDYNECASHLEYTEEGDIIPDYSFAEISALVEKEYNNIKDKEVKAYLNSYTTTCKPMMSSAIYTEFNITGVDFGLFGEANINTYQPAAGYPMVMAHEIAHTKGVMREADANLMAMYILLHSDNYYLRFSGYYWGFYRIMELANYTGNSADYDTLNNKICYEIKLNDWHSYQFWKKHNLLERFADWWNNLYIKSSGDENGTESYNDTPSEIDEEKEIVVTFSVWQRLYLQIYYDNK